MVNKIKYFSNKDINDFRAGDHFQLHEKMGAHPHQSQGKDGYYFSVWAPNAKNVSVIGEFNSWNKKTNPLLKRSDLSGIWEGFVKKAKQGQGYKFYIRSLKRIASQDRIDPFAFYFEKSPDTASILWNLKYRWSDGKWLNKRKKTNFSRKPISIYELHLGSWQKRAGGEFLSYKELAPLISEYIQKEGFTHVEFLPLMEHPFCGSWGYQTLGYFAPTSRYGSPEDLMFLIDHLHQNNIGVILDWVPSHFPNDAHGLHKYDGSNLYETGELHPDWRSCIFNFGKNEVVSFLLSNMYFWLKYYHIDGIRMDAVASMLYLDYSRKEGEWKPNILGSQENLDAVAFIRKANKIVKEEFPGVLTIAEESSFWPNVTRPTELGGLNFDMKWNLGWMHDTLTFFNTACRSRPKKLKGLMKTFGYSFLENHILSLSHDEVVHLKKSLLMKMPGVPKEKFSHLRCLLSYFYAFPGKKLLFMGGEIGQKGEWNHDQSLNWDLLDKKENKGVQTLIEKLNRVYKKESALFAGDFLREKFENLTHENDKSVICFLRRSNTKKPKICVIFNFTKMQVNRYQIKVPNAHNAKIILNSSDKCYGGENNTLKLKVKKSGITLNVPSLSVIYLKYE